MRLTFVQTLNHLADNNLSADKIMTNTQFRWFFFNVDNLFFFSFLHFGILFSFVCDEKDNSEEGDDVWIKSERVSIRESRKNKTIFAANREHFPWTKKYRNCVKVLLPVLILTFIDIISQFVCCVFLKNNCKPKET